MLYKHLQTPRTESLHTDLSVVKVLANHNSFYFDLWFAVFKGNALPAKQMKETISLANTKLTLTCYRVGCCY